ncbi:hypothetical protein UPYG_G00236080 [Umbra pygmaea]|uniref:Transmembrane 4 L6 family member 5-like n=1 Tax=Umbra pygmaea TaxID=75934 RepID=A0ABD0WEG9_UMBPY
MCTGKCSKVIAVSLYVLAGVSILCNIIAFFPGWSVEYAKVDSEGNGARITDEVKYMGGLIGGGLMCLVPAIHIHLTSSNGCCANRCGMFLSIGFAAAGVVGALYSLSTSALGLSNGPVCLYKPKTGTEMWGRPFLEDEGNYLGNTSLWNTCIEPDNVVEFNVGLFATLLVAACVELVLCAIQMVNGLFGCLCGTCSSKEEV